jgi:hypothetical protein
LSSRNYYFGERFSAALLSSECGSGTIFTPGINGPTSMASIRNADNNLAQLTLGLDADNGKQRTAGK